jgi:hypothetical protein
VEDFSSLSGVSAQEWLKSSVWAQPAPPTSVSSVSEAAVISTPPSMMPPAANQAEAIPAAKLLGPLIK